MPSEPKVCFFFDTVDPSLRERKKLKAFIEKIFQKEKKPLINLNIIFTSNARLKRINKQYLGHNYNTDVISFDLSTNNSTEGEIYVSMDQVAKNAKEYNIPLKQEMLRVVFHGVLHLCGYGDKTRKEKDEMRKKENVYLEAFGVPRGNIFD